ncbi:FG-GAP-like repeat-containing protein [Bacteroides faecis]|jgi:hypothetical protein|uniref:tRNA(Glu)-specific nuclease WapA n=1 Tax=Bacteroides faecis TaxID=674529 RepID=A0A6N2TCA0_9BACE|nr:FG-GAP-like repeat-containing protein [Bacteroides faecis]MCS3066070.1 FG-GAP-like repeat-containing protein [Bacteroides faecis]
MRNITQRLIILGITLLVVLSTKAQGAVALKDVDVSCDVGEIPVQYTLSPTGAVTYQVPMNIHSASNGFQPQLSFSYNSQQTESVLGYGWSMAGMSSVVHVGGSIYYDGKTTPLSLSEDKLMLDGIRLIKQGTDTWQTEQGFVKVKKLSDGVLEARYPNGNIATFETSSSAPFSYVMTNCRDTKGSNIHYEYNQINNLAYIQKILYGENENNYTDSIVFRYRDATGGLVRYIDGKSMENSKLLDRVESYHRGVLWRRYRLTYEKKEVDLLVRLDCETETRSLNPLRFEYGEDGIIEYFQSRNIHLENYFMNNVIGNYDALALSRGRFKPKSISDGLISYPQKSTYSVIMTRNLGGVLSYQFGSTYASNQKLAIYQDLSGFNIDTPPATLTAGYGFQQLAAVDVSGTGVDALVKVNYDIDNSSESLKLAIYNNIDNLNSYKEYKYEIFTRVHDGAFVSPRQREFLFGDFNGDGKMELLAIATCRNHNERDKNNSSHAWLINLQTGEKMLDKNVFDYAFFQQNPDDIVPDRLLTIDYNGDGKTDVCLINHTGTYIYEFTGDGFKKIGYTATLNLKKFANSDRELMIADINGDGNMDLVLAPPYSEGTDQAIITDGGRSWDILLSTGNSENSNTAGFVTYSTNIVRSFSDAKGKNFILTDVDSDGLPDLLRKAQGKIELYLNKKGKINTYPEERATLTLGNPNAQLTIANVSQSYYWPGELICVDDQNIYSYNYTRKEIKERMLHALIDSYGMRTEHYYFDIQATNSTRYEVNYNLAAFDYPYVVMTPHCYVAAWAKKMMGDKMGDWTSWIHYKYTNAVFHRTGLGFRGFQQIETTDFDNNKLKTRSTFDPTFMGAEVKTETPTDTIVRSYVLDVNTDKTFVLKLQKENDLNVLNQTETKVEYTYDAYGQVLNSITSKGSSFTEYHNLEYQNIDSSNKYLLGLLTTDATMTICNDSICSREMTIEYDENNMPVNKTTFFNGMPVSEERFAYDVKKRLIKHERRPYESIDWLSNTYTYNSMGQLLRDASDIGLYVDYQYDEVTGLLKSSTDHKGRVTQNEYDEWGNLLVTYRPDGSKKQIVTRWSDEEEPGLFCVTVSVTGQPIVKTYYDLMGRVVRNSQIRFDGKELKTDKVYNVKTGLLERESQPTTDDVPNHWNTYSYDNFFRQTSISYTSGKVDSCAYGVLTDTIIENGIIHVRQFDELGRMIKTTDAGGSMEYYYRPDGQPIVAVAPGGVQTRFYYDRYGRRTAIKDPSAGIRRTEYDIFGNISKEIDADGREILNEYDRYGRVTRQVTPDMVTVYTYDDTENLLLSAVSDNGTATRYMYDEYARLKTYREEAPEGKWLQKTYTYTVDGLLLSITYTSGEGILSTELMTYRNGYLSEVRLSDGTLIYCHNEENAMGQLTRLSVGNMQRNYEFNNYGLPVSRKITRADNSEVFNHSYLFNVSNNNLEKHTDKVHNLTEVFTYDALNRLSTYGNASATYDNNGNILSKSDAGTLAYTNPNRPYSVTGLNPVIVRQDLEGLNITYTAAERPSVITKGTIHAMLSYNANHDRVRMQVSDGANVTLTRYYLNGNYELDVVDSTEPTERLYLGGNYYDAPAVLVKQNGQSSVYYIHRDYLGSVLQIVDTKGKIVEENSFDAWGCRRNPVTQVVYATDTAPKLMLGRGFTGHEHLAMFGLINMNARLYDPVLGRFLSPDPYVQVLGFTQAFNRFSYCMNSPLCYVDENGEFWWIAAAAFIGGAINVATNWKNIDNFWQGVGYFGVGATAGAIGALTGGAALAVTGGLGGAAGGAIAGFVGGATSGFILGGGNTLMAGGSLYDAWSNGLTGAYTGAATGAVLGGIGGGFTSYLKGENVWSGRDIATGRNAFSLKNTPINETVHHRPVGSNPNPISPKPKLPQSEIRDYSVTTYENSHVNPMMEGKGLMNRPLQIEGYDVRLASQNDLYHAFPRSFDEQIVKGGWLYGNSGNSTMMVAPGTVNGVNGIYTLGINTETGIIYHRAFYEWGGFMKNFKFPTMPY